MVESTKENVHIRALVDGVQHCKCFPGKTSCPICRGTGWVMICDKCEGAGMKDNKVCGRCAGHGKMLMPRPASVKADANDGN